MRRVGFPLAAVAVLLVLVGCAFPTVKSGEAAQAKVAFRVTIPATSAQTKAKAPVAVKSRELAPSKMTVAQIQARALSGRPSASRALSPLVNRQSRLAASKTKAKALTSRAAVPRSASSAARVLVYDVDYIEVTSYSDAGNYQVFDYYGNYDYDTGGYFFDILFFTDPGHNVIFVDAYDYYGNWLTTTEDDNNPDSFNFNLDYGENVLNLTMNPPTDNSVNISGSFYSDITISPYYTTIGYANSAAYIAVTNTGASQTQFSVSSDAYDQIYFDQIDQNGLPIEDFPNNQFPTVFVDPGETIIVEAWDYDDYYGGDVGDLTITYGC